MIAYHVDRKQHLNVGDIIKLNATFKFDPRDISDFTHSLFPKGLSKHGESYLLTPYAARDCSLPIAEFIFESIRVKNFSNLPSRYQSFFCFLSIDDAIRSGLLNDEGSVYEIEVTDYFLADMNLTCGSFSDINSTLSILAICNRANMYWSGARTELPLFEVLAIPPVRVTRKVSL